MYFLRSSAFSLVSWIGAGTSPWSTTSCPSSPSLALSPAMRSAEGPMSTPRRPAPRSRGTPMMWTGFTVCRILYGATGADGAEVRRSVRGQRARCEGPTVLKTPARALSNRTFRLRTGPRTLALRPLAPQALRSRLDEVSGACRRGSPVTDAVGDANGPEAAAGHEKPGQIR